MAVKQLIEQGEKIAVEANHPLILDDPARAWVVEDGRVEVFAIRRKNGVPFGHRTNLFTAEPGDVIWGTGSAEETPDIGLVATGIIGTQVTEFSVAPLADLCRDGDSRAEVVSLVENWVRNAVGGIATQVLPKDYVQLGEAGKLELAEGMHGLSKEGVLWVRPREGSAVFRAKEDTDCALDSLWFPLSGRGSIVALETCTLSVMSTNDLLAEETGLEAIGAFNRVLLRSIVALEESLIRRESRRMREREQQSGRTLRASLRGLSEVMRPWAEGEFLERGAESPLLAACRLVGQKGEIDIRAPRGDRDDLARIADASRMRTRQVILKDRWWKGDNGPLLGFLDDGNRPVALLPVSKSLYELHDPETGEHRVVDEHTAQTLKPFAHTFYRPFAPKALGAKDLLRFGIKSAWKSDLWTVLVLGLAGGALGMITPVATGFIFDKVIPQAERAQLMQLGLFLIVSAVASFSFQVAQSIAMLRAESRMNGSMQAAVWDRLLSLPVPFFRRFTTGDLAMRADGINAIRRSMTTVAMNAVFAGIFSLFNLILLFVYSEFLAWRALGLVAISILVTAFLSWLTIRHQKEIAEISGRLNGLVLQIIAGIAKFRVSGSERRAYHLWAGDFGRRRRRQFKAESISNAFAVWNSVFPVLASVAIFYLVVSKDTGDLSLGDFLAFNSAFNGFSSAMLSLSSALIGVVSIVPLWERTKPILEAIPEYDESKKDPGELRGDIEVGHVKFRYDPDGPLILDDVHVSINRGEFLALVGPSGSGKSTLLRLLLGFEEPESGTIYFDGQDRAMLDLRSVRSQIGVVLQNGRVMAGDIHSNIIGTASDLKVSDVWEAAEAAGLADDIRAMPMGLYTHVSEGGGTLSGGQRQRLLIARAVVNRPRILFFDEATSALDNRTQGIVSRSLETLNATRVVVAHRLSTVVGADRIVVMSKGRVVQEGTYETLMKEGGLFADLAKRQLA